MLIATNAERESLGNGVYRNVISLAPIGYRDTSGNLQRIVDTWGDGDATYPHVVSSAPIRVRAAANGDRRLLPVPGDDDAWLSISSPFIKIGGVWQKPNLGPFTRQGNILKAEAANVDTYIWQASHYIKAGFELKNGWLPQDGQFAFRVDLQGLTRQGGQLLYDGLPVMGLRKPVVYDAANPEDTREIAHEFVTLNGQAFILFTLPDTTGMDRVVVDPTFTAQPDAAAGIDTYMFANFPTGNYATGTTLNIDSRTGTVNERRAILKFDLSSIPAGATVTGGSLAVVQQNLASNANCTFEIARILAANGGWTEAGATWNTIDGVTAWAGAGTRGGCSQSGTDFSSTAMGSATVNTGTANGTTHTFTFSSTAEVESMIANNYGLTLYPPSSVNYNVPSFYSSDDTTASNRPLLTIEYTLPAGWWNDNGNIAGCIGAWQGVDVASQAVSYEDLSGYERDLTAPVAAPTWATETGWTFNGSTQYLDTGYVPVGSNRSVIVRFANGAAGARSLFGILITGHRFYILPDSSGNVHYGNSSSVTTSSPGVGSGVLAVNDDYGYRNGTQDVALGSSFNTNTYNMLIGAYNQGGTVASYFQGDILAIAIYDTSLSGADIATITAAMQALGSGGTSIPAIMHHLRQQGIS